MTVAKTARLYCRPVYERLGFFNHWEIARRALLTEGQAASFPLDALFAQWRGRGRFMYSVNHPVLPVLADLARELAHRASLRVTVDNPEEYLSDALADGSVWPVYPEIAAWLGLPGSYAFKPPTAPRATPVMLDLERFIAGSFESYARFGPAELVCKRLDNPAYRDLERVAEPTSTS